MRRILACLLLLLPAAVPVSAQSFTDSQRAELVEILRRALREDPSILRDALTGLEAADQRARAEARRAAVAQQAEALFRNARDPSRGNPRGDVTIVEFFDARCGFCKQLHPALEALLRRDPNVRVVMKDLPILGPNSVMAARALLAAQRQGRYAQLQDALMTLRVEPTEPVLRQQAERVGLDWSRLRRDMDDAAIAQRIEANVQLAQALGVEGTPALVIGSTPNERAAGASPGERAAGASPGERAAGATLVPGAVDLPELERLVAAARAGR